MIARTHVSNPRAGLARVFNNGATCSRVATWRRAATAAPSRGVRQSCASQITGRPSPERRPWHAAAMRSLRRAAGRRLRHITQSDDNLIDRCARPVGNQAPVLRSDRRATDCDGW